METPGRRTSAQDIASAVWPESMPPGAMASATASALSVSAMVGVGVGFESAGAAFAGCCLLCEQQAMKTEGCAEGTDFVHPESPRATGVRRRGRYRATAPWGGVDRWWNRATLSLARLAASCDASDGRLSTVLGRKPPRVRGAVRNPLGVPAHSVVLALGSPTARGLGAQTRLQNR